MSDSLLSSIFSGLLDDLLDRESVPLEKLTDAKSIIRAYRDNPTARSAWKGITKEEWCTRFERLIEDPRSLNQRPTDYCMPASCLYVLFKRFPANMANFCVNLAREGTAFVGQLEITMTPELLDYDVHAYARANLAGIDTVDYALFLTMQEAMSFTDLKDPSSYAAAPGIFVSNIENLLSSTDLFNVNRIDNPTADDLASIPSEAEAVLVGNISLFSTAPPLGNHAAVFVPPVVIDAGMVSFRFWSWGLYEGAQTLRIADHAYVSEHTVRFLELNLDSIITLSPKD